MVDNFLTDLLKIIIVVDDLAIIAYFMVGAGRRRAQMPAPSTQARIPAEGLSLESNRLPETIPAPSLRQRLERPFRRLWWRSRHTAPSSYSLIGEPGYSFRKAQARSHKLPRGPGLIPPSQRTLGGSTPRPRKT